ncbi:MULTISPECIES: hypothetical protein [unclassified Arthrobacter]|uniref:hypothetical protein n=1 Tax=unclassified Arthrobacter TaxID=235627 RepID=UPI0014927AE5|nr:MULTISPECIES: hypothetical protein [unclassified Arthrobacter]MBE0011138.1 hypothetical protein [Arthrobacter sp. AET 35A]NOJ63274.1 hypothetical protein [Arthrobacter sp. 147(2020)]
MTIHLRSALTDPASPVFGIASVGVMGGLTLVDDAKLNDRDRRTMRVVSAVVSGFYVGVTSGGKQLPLRVLAGFATGVATLRFATASEAIDRRLEQKLRQFGAQQPRRWMAAGTAVLIVAGYLADRSAAKRERQLALTTESESVVVDHAVGTAVPTEE